MHGKWLEEYKVKLQSLGENGLKITPESWIKMLEKREKLIIILLNIRDYNLSSFNDVYKFKKEGITDMLNASPAFHDFWSQSHC